MVKDKKNIPEGVWILSVLSFVGAGLSIMFGWLALSAYDLLRGTKGYPLVETVVTAVGPEQNITGYISPGAILGIGILLIGLGILSYYIARGLLKSQNWSRIVLAILSVLGIILTIISLKNVVYLTSIVSILINGLIVWYLLKKESVKRYFE